MTTALMMNTSTGVSGVRVWQIPGMGNGRDCGVTATTAMASWRADRIPPPRRRWRCASWWRGCVPPAATGSRQRRERKHVDGRVRGPHRADTGDGRRWRSRRVSDNDDDVEEGGPTPLTTATCELVARLHFVGIPYASEASLSDVDDVNGR